MRSLKFHQGFKLDRGRLATLLGSMAEGRVVTKRAGSQIMGVGEPAAEGSIGWLVKTGLGSAVEKGYRLSPFGELVAAHDPGLEHDSTLWLMHYHLASDNGERSEVWHRAFNEFLAPDTPFTRDELQTYVERSLEGLPTNQSAVSDDCKEFVKCYTGAGGLSKLGLVRAVGANRFNTGLERHLDPGVVAYALFDAWERRFPQTDTLRLSQICAEPEFLGRLFAARREQVVEMLQILQSMGMLNVVDSQHEPVTRRFREPPEQLLATLYGLS